MIIYPFLLLFIIATYPLFRTRTLLKTKTVIEKNRFYTLIITFVLTVIAGLRGLSVGIDTYNYYYSFISRSYLSFSDIFIGVTKEYGYRLFEFSVNLLFSNFQILLIIVALLYVGAVSYNIYKHSSIPFLSYIYFIGFGFYTFGMTATRQTIAIALILIAFQYIYKKQLIKFLLIVGLASTFHVTALVFLPSYWFNKFKLNKRSVLFLAVIVLGFLIFKDKLRELLLYYSGVDYGSSETGGNRFYFLLIFSLLIGIIYRKPFLEKSENNKYLFFMIIAATIIIPMTQFHPAVMRLSFYYSIFLILYIPNILNAINDRIIRLIGNYGYVLASLYMFFSNTISSSNLESYTFFWQQ
ncbi:EpsG family protein [Paenibacillus cremeus]|uniref:EpsG family protein n=1 Tax=Paenibacillus cremeus TaxID=2163881 RepID=A0A559K533_9BACL|nr:EpsG family protein [Paenibacillus cremeus]TVY07216.1 EpsG family protein [Paenibacillus cremeus]